MKTDFTVTGMSCAACSARVEKAVRSLDGVYVAECNLLTGGLRVEFDENAVSVGNIVSAVEKAGYGAKEKRATTEKVEKPSVDAENERDLEIRREKSRVIWSFVLLVPLMYVSMGHMLGLPLPGFLSGDKNSMSFALMQFLLCLPVAYINRKYYINGFKAAARLSPNMDTLIALGSSASLLYGVAALFGISAALGEGLLTEAAKYAHDLYFESAVMILALINLGKFFEAKSKGKTGSAIEKLKALAPDTAIVERGDDVVTLPIAQVRTGDILRVNPGSRVPADGFLIGDGAFIDESALTGESMPVEKREGDTVTCATINLNRFFRMRVTRTGEDTTFSQIVRMVEDASAGKAPIAKLADRVSGIFVPIVMLIACITAAIWLISGAAFSFSLTKAISVLVISCPCALGLATPVAIMVGTGKGAEHGILIKSGSALEIAGKVDCVVMDKTGTLTRGEATVTRVVTHGMSEAELLSIAAAVESDSDHPLAKAITKLAKERGYSVYESEGHEAVPGLGVTATVNGERVYAGNARFMERASADFSAYEKDLDSITANGGTPLMFAKSNMALGVISVSDDVKPTSNAAVRGLHALNIETVMLTGDNERTAKAVCESLGVKRFIAGVLPADKAHEIERLKAEGKRVMMVGDGINDSPALKTADIGVAIGAGADIAIDSADIILMKNDPMDIANAIRLSRRVMTTIRENLFHAFFYNALGIPVAAGALNFAGLSLSPMLAAAMMSVSSLLVVTNALRLRSFKPQRYEEERNMYTVKIEGMMCVHCKKRVEDALNGIAGVKAEVELENKLARVEAPETVSAEAIKKVVTDAGYEVISISR